MKNITKGYVIWGILFVLVSVVAFVVPTQKTPTFWSAYIFMNLAFVTEIGIWKMGFGKEETLKSKFFNFPIIHLGIIYIILQVIVFAVFMFMPMLPVWSSIVVFSVSTGVFSVCVIAAEVGRNEIVRIEEKIQKKISYIRELQVDIEMLANNERDADVKEALIQLGEKIRFSEPMSNDQLVDVEEQIFIKVRELKTTSNKIDIITEISSLLDERNKKCKILK